MSFPLNLGCRFLVTYSLECIAWNRLAQESHLLIKIVRGLLSTWPEIVSRPEGEGPVKTSALVIVSVDFSSNGYCRPRGVAQSDIIHLVAKAKVYGILG